MELHEQASPMGSRVLVVDDNHDIVNIVESWLKANDYEVYTAYSERRGWQKLNC